MANTKPTITGTTHPLPFDRLSPDDFERLCLWLVEREGYERAEHLGAAGSEGGRDVIAWRGGEQWAFQCKRVRRFGPREALVEVKKVLALPKTERPAGLVFLVSCDVSANARQQARDRCQGQMVCHFWVGTELDEKVKRHPDIVAEFFQLAARPPGPPLQRPPRADHFTGRQAELAWFLDSLQPGRVVTLCGPGGMGKTALAAEAVWALAPGDEPPERFPDGVIFYSFYGRPDVALAFEHIVRSFDETARDTSPSAAYRVLSRKRALLILDGTEEAGDLRAVLEVRGGCGVLVTSHARGDAVAERRDLPPLHPGEAMTLLRAWGKRGAAGDAAARRICELVGRLPLALRLVGRYLDQTGEPAAEYLAWLQDTPIEALSHGQHREESVDLLLARSLEQVSEGARQVLAVVGLLALAPFAVEPVAQAAGLATRATKHSLGQLVNYGLLLRHPQYPIPNPYEVSHALAHTYARRRMVVPDETAGRLAAYYTQLAETESEKGLAGYRQLDAERGHLMRVLAGCVERESWEAARSLVWAVEDYLDMQGHWTERVTALEMGVKAAQGLGHRRDEGAFLGNLGLAYSDLGQVERAIEYFQQALAIAREIGDRRNEGNHLGNLGLAYRALGQVERAIEYHEAALAIAREIGDRRMEGNAVGNLGNAYRALGQVERAIEYYEQALAIAREIGDRRGEGNGLGNLGNAYRDLGQVERAIEYHWQGLAISREIGDRRGEGFHAWNLGLLYKENDPARAVELMSVRVAYEREIGHPDAEAHARRVAEIRARMEA